MYFTSQASGATAGSVAYPPTTKLVFSLFFFFSPSVFFFFGFSFGFMFLSFLFRSLSTRLFLSWDTEKKYGRSAKAVEDGGAGFLLQTVPFLGQKQEVACRFISIFEPPVSSQL